MSNHTDLSVAPAVKVIGVSTPVTVNLDESAWRSTRRPPTSNRMGARYPLFEESSPANRLFWSRHQTPRTVAFEAGKKQSGPALKEGKSAAGGRKPFRTICAAAPIRWLTIST